MEQFARKLNRIKKIFLTGLIVTFPIGVTVLVIKWLFTAVDSILAKPASVLFDMEVPGLGILLTLIIIFLVGLIASNVLGKSLTSYIEKLFLKVPFIKTIYSPVKEIFKRFTSKSSQGFKQVVLVDFPTQGKKSIGFLTNDNIVMNGKRKVCVFIPTTPNPTSGFMIIMEEAEIEILDISIEDALKLIVSLGTIGPEKM